MTENFITSVIKGRGATTSRKLYGAYLMGGKKPRGKAWREVQANTRWLLRTVEAGCVVPDKLVTRYAWWTAQDYTRLIQAIKPGVTLSKLSRAVGRTPSAVAAKLRQVGMTHHRAKPYHHDVWSLMARKTNMKVTVRYKEVDFNPILVSKGWRETLHGWKLPTEMQLQELKR